MFWDKLNSATITYADGEIALETSLDGVVVKILRNNGVVRCLDCATANGTTPTQKPVRLN
jgi:hypothetical protein